MPLTSYCRVFPSADNPGQSIIFSTRTAAALLVHDELIKAVALGEIPAEERAVLAEYGFLVESAEVERQEMLGFVDDLNAADKTYRPLIVLNLDCNLACAYCFEGTRKGRHYLSEETAGALLRHLERRGLPGRDDLHVTFYGGEPLLSFDMMLRLAARMKALCDTAGIPFGFSLITNGTLLTRDRVDRLRPLGLGSASVTLDGPRTTHDAARPYRSGAGSFDTILRNLRAVAGLVDLQIGGNFTRENYEQFPRLLDELVAAGLTPGVVSLVRFDPVFREQEGVAHADFHGGCTTPGEPWLFEATVFLREQVLRRGYRTGRVMPSRCMMDVPSHPVINWDGSMYSCPGLIGRSEGRIGNLGPPADARGSKVPPNWHDQTCLSCAYLPLCFGGCRYLKLLRDGDMSGVDCRKPYFDAVLEPLVLQDLRYRRHQPVSVLTGL